MAEEKVNKGGGQKGNDNPKKYDIDIARKFTKTIYDAIIERLKTYLESRDKEKAKKPFITLTSAFIELQGSEVIDLKGNPIPYRRSTWDAFCDKKEGYYDDPVVSQTIKDIKALLEDTNYEQGAYKAIDGRMASLYLSANAGWSTKTEVTEKTELGSISDDVVSELVTKVQEKRDAANRDNSNK